MLSPGTTCKGPGPKVPPGVDGTVPFGRLISMPRGAEGGVQRLRGSPESRAVQTVGKPLSRASQGISTGGRRRCCFPPPVPGFPGRADDALSRFMPKQDHEASLYSTSMKAGGESTALCNHPNTSKMCFPPTAAVEMPGPPRAQPAGSVLQLHSWQVQSQKTPAEQEVPRGLQLSSRWKVGLLLMEMVWTNFHSSRVFPNQQAGLWPDRSPETGCFLLGGCASLFQEELLLSPRF